MTLQIALHEQCTELKMYPLANVYWIIFHFDQY